MSTSRSRSGVIRLFRRSTDRTVESYRQRRPLLRQTVRLGLAATVLAGMVSFSGCAWVGGDVDAAGMTQEEVERLPLERQFDLLGGRYVRMQEMLADAQRAVSTGTWTWGSKGFGPTGGDGQRWSMRDATSKNSYYLNTSRAIQLPGASGAVEDAELMAEYFEAQGWSTTLGQVDARRYRVEAMTDEGFWFEYQVRPHGQY